MGSAHNSMPILAANRQGCPPLNGRHALGPLTWESRMEVPSSPGSRRITRSDMTRRELMEVAALTGAALVGGQLMPGSGPPAAAQAAGAAPAPLNLLLRVNGADHSLALDPRTTLLDALREHLHLTGSKKGCGLGQCGACTVLMDGKRMKSCLSLAALVEGREITTIEGLAQGEQLHPRQPALSKRAASQLGYCTPGQSMPASAGTNVAHPVSRREFADGQS